MDKLLQRKRSTMKRNNSNSKSTKKPKMEEEKKNGLRHSNTMPRKTTFKLLKKINLSKPREKISIDSVYYSKKKQKLILNSHHEENKFLFIYDSLDNYSLDSKVEINDTPFSFAELPNGYLIYSTLSSCRLDTLNLNTFQIVTKIPLNNAPRGIIILKDGRVCAISIFILMIDNIQKVVYGIIIYETEEYNVEFSLYLEDPSSCIEDIVEVDERRIITRITNSYNPKSNSFVPVDIQEKQFIRESSFNISNTEITSMKAGDNGNLILMIKNKKEICRVINISNGDIIKQIYPDKCECDNSFFNLLCLSNEMEIILYHNIYLLSASKNKEKRMEKPTLFNINLEEAISACQISENTFAISNEDKAEIYQMIKE